MFKFEKQTIIKYKNFQHYVYKMFFLKNFSQKNVFQAFSSIIYNLIFFLICCIGFIPIICAFINSIDFNNHSNVVKIFFLVSYITNFFFLFDIILRFLTMMDFYNAKKLKIALKKQISSVYTYIEIITFLTTIILLSSYGNFVSDGIFINNQKTSSIILTIISFVFLSNLMNCFHRLMLFSHNENEIKMFQHIIKNKLKIWFIFIVVILIILFSFSFFIYISDQSEATSTNPSDFNNMGDALYFCVVTITTVGFGDIVAKTNVSKVYVVLLMIIGVFLYSFLSSQIISVFGEYFTGKKQISQEVFLTKKKEEELNNLVNNIENTLLSTLYEAKVISKKNYDRIIKAKNEQEKIIDNKYDDKNFTFDQNNKAIYYKDKILGNIINDEPTIKNASNTIWVVDKKMYSQKQLNPATILYKLPMKQVTYIADPNINTQVIFSKSNIPLSVKKIIFYQKKPYLSAICQAEVKGILSSDDIDMVWNKFGIYSNWTKKKFYTVFKENSQVCVILITNIIIYDTPKSIQEYGINDKDLLDKSFTPLI